MEGIEMEQRRGLRLLTGMLAAVAVALLLVSMAASVDVDAARGAGSRGGGKKGGGSTPCSTCVLTVSPNQVPLGSTSFVASGTGFGANQTVVLSLSGVSLQSVTTDGSGAFSMNYPFDAFASGVWYRLDAKDAGMTTVLAST